LCFRQSSRVRLSMMYLGQFWREWDDPRLLSNDRAAKLRFTVDIGILSAGRVAAQPRSDHDRHWWGNLSIADKRGYFHRQHRRRTDGPRDDWIIAGAVAGGVNHHNRTAGGGGRIRWRNVCVCAVVFALRPAIKYFLIPGSSRS